MGLLSIKNTLEDEIIRCTDAMKTLVLGSQEYAHAADSLASLTEAYKNLAMTGKV